MRKLCSRAFPALQEKASWAELLLFVSPHRGQLKIAEKGARYTSFKTKSHSLLQETHGAGADFDGRSAGGTCAFSGPSQKVRRDVAHNTRRQRKTRAWVEHFVWLTTADVPDV